MATTSIIIAILLLTCSALLLGFLPATAHARASPTGNNHLEIMVTLRTVEYFAVLSW